jgi:hypothetical protein
MSGENADNYGDDGLEHGARSRRSTGAALQLPLPDCLALARASQELVAAAPVVVSEELD